MKRKKLITANFAMAVSSRLWLCQVGVMGEEETTPLFYKKWGDGVMEQRSNGFM
jgi:hypothetical protein